MMFEKSKKYVTTGKCGNFIKTGKGVKIVLHDIIGNKDKGGGIYFVQKDLQQGYPHFIGL